MSAKWCVATNLKTLHTTDTYAKQHIVMDSETQTELQNMSDTDEKDLKHLALQMIEMYKHHKSDM